jgi:acetylornithine deacetylase/succinyl-diaminopimelate desuccinylase-like protein
MAVAFRHLASSGFRPRGDLIFLAVADEESGSRYGMQWMADHAADAVRADYVLTENGGLHSGPAEAPYVGINVGEKGVAWRRLRVRGVPGHGSMPAWCSAWPTTGRRRACTSCGASG